VTLTAERPVVGREAVPVERVRLGKETTTEERQVTDQVRKEEIELDDQTGSERKQR
ncbi:MAG: YsnF/AvaK domain-containing protein, partial [Candidatus Dormibacteraeota bacterium]|nr:YsnF/AvaK domain-containing protein [Candidatus Dormibacteraeota bacterium]